MPVPGSEPTVDRATMFTLRTFQVHVEPNLADSSLRWARLLTGSRDGQALVAAGTKQKLDRRPNLLCKKPFIRLPETKWAFPTFRRTSKAAPVGQGRLWNRQTSWQRPSSPELRTTRTKLLSHPKGTCRAPSNALRRGRGPGDRVEQRERGPVGQCGEPNQVGVEAATGNRPGQRFTQHV